MTYCVGVMLDDGMIFASDSRTHAGMDNIAKFCKMAVFERRDGGYLEDNEIGFNASFVVGGQIGGEPMRLFRIYAEGNFRRSSCSTWSRRSGSEGTRRVFRELPELQW